MSRGRSLWILLLFIIIQPANGQPTIASVKSLKFLGKYIVPYNQPFHGTTIGGLSGIDYDAKNDRYFLISDDRSAIEPARFYTAKIHISEKGIDTVIFDAVNILLRENGQPYPSAKQDRAHTPDPESIRHNPLTNQLVWTSEGERIQNNKDTVLANPAIIVADLTGKYVGEFSLPENLRMNKASSGPRQNGTLEGIAFANNYSDLFACMEEPLFEDGPRAQLQPVNAWVRIYQFNFAERKNVAQYAYPLEPIAFPASPPTAFKINGIPEILSIGNNKLIVIERSFSTGRLACTIKVYLADLRQATNIASVKSLQESPTAQLVKKRLLANMDDLKIHIDNVEGVVQGPTLPNGHKTLVFVADNNFNSFEQTQFLLFEVIP